MVESTTLNYHWTKPELTKSPTTWGKFLNDDLDAIDGLVFANQQAVVPIGTVTMFAGPTAPTNWLICDGRSISTAAPYDKLFAVLQYAFGGSGANFKLPNLQSVFPLGAGAGNALGSAGGAYTISLATANLPAHAHPIVDVAHNHTASQPAHNHGDFGHGHGVNDPQHFHTTPNTALGSGVNVQPGSGFNLNGATTTDYKPTGISIQTGFANLAAAQPAITVTASGTGLSTTQNVGSGAAINLPKPQYVAINFIIRYQ